MSGIVPNIWEDNKGSGVTQSNDKVSLPSENESQETMQKRQQCEKI